jgi:hypothetical protein
MKNWKLTTECGYRWRWEQNYYWKFGFRLLNKEWVDGIRVTGEPVGVAFGPVMFFWKWL